ncbi:hypothetical protein F4776DRAFT_675543 [Hypoxylon sp. NC0597]|nr:hypothetical protein F4776DRAFT_675543 [Hypoxylon sp. NC0597]
MSQLPMRNPSGGDSEAKRRKIRKGTHSCWECRRRKTRCQFSSSTATICIGCEARGTTCVSQEFAEEQQQTPERGLSQRLTRVEGLLEKLVERIAPDTYTSGRLLNQALPSSVSVGDQLDSSSDILRPSAADHHSVVCIFDALREDCGTSASAHTSFVPTPASTQGEAGAALPPKYAHISKALHAAFPSQHDIDTILAAGNGAYFIVMFFSGVDGPFEPPSSISEVPSVTSHPALLAKRLMQLTSCMQKISSNAVPQELISRETIRMQVSRIASVVSDLVVSNDDLVGSVEGLETLGLMGLYQYSLTTSYTEEAPIVNKYDLISANAGNLRKSWLSIRRALSVAQLMGADRWPDDKLLKSVDPRSDPSTRTRASGLWYRLNFSDRYLSLLLGLPAASDDNSFADPERMAHSPPSERLERIHTAISGAIIKRNLSTHKSAADAAFGTTQAIDCDLETAAKSMGAEWWQPLEPIDTLTATPVELVRAHEHVMMQMNHHHLLILLHLPYMMRDPKERRWDYSKTTCLHSSRELLRAYLFFRHLTDAASACRHTDYGALTAAMTLLLGYLDPKLRARDVATSSQRDADRNLVLAVRDTVKGMAERDDDKLARETSDIVTRLLPLTDVDLTMGDSGGGISSPPVRLEIPYLGTININPVNRRTPQQQLQQDGTSITPEPASYGDNREGYTEQRRFRGSTTSGNISHAIDNPGTSTMDPSLQQPLQASSSFLASLGEDANFSFMQFEPDLSSPYQFPELAADVDQWTFQGFDAAFFENLFK